MSETYETQVQLLDSEETHILSVELTLPSSPYEPIEDFWADSDGNVFAITNEGTFLKYVPEE